MTTHTYSQWGQHLPPVGNQGAAVTARRYVHSPRSQPCLPGMGPELGAQYHNRHTGEVAVVVDTIRRRRCWVILRHRGREVEIRLDLFEEHWRPGRGATLSKRLAG